MWKVVARFSVVENYDDFYSPRINKVMPGDIEWFMLRLDQFTNGDCIGLLIQDNKVCEVQKQLLSLHLKFGKAGYDG